MPIPLSTSESDTQAAALREGGAQWAAELGPATLAHALREASPDQAAVDCHSGPVVAATLAPLLGFFTLVVSHHVSRLSKALDQLVHAYGYWIPGSQGSGPAGSIGSYSGKETLALAVWGITWLLFHQLWKNQDFSLRRWFPVFAAGLGLATLGLFHPIIDPVVLALASLAGLP